MKYSLLLSFVLLASALPAAETAVPAPPVNEKTQTQKAPETPVPAEKEKAQAQKAPETPVPAEKKLPQEQAKPSQPPGNAAPDALEQNVTELLAMIRRESPEIYRRLQEIPREKLHETLFQALKTGITPVVKMPEIKLPASAPPVTPYPAKLILSNTVFYARIDGLTAGTLKQLREDMAASSRLAVPPIGAILDLRSAGGGDYALIDAFLSLFQPPPKVSKDAFGFHSVPLAVLCGRKTGGAAELLTALLEHSRLGITLGETCSGTAFPKKIAVFNGKMWLVPQIGNPAWRNILPYACTPVISIPATEQIPPEKLGKVRLAETDPSIRRAADLVTSLSKVGLILK